MTEKEAERLRDKIVRAIKPILDDHKKVWNVEDNYLIQDAIDDLLLDLFDIQP